ncbi:MAG TPA: hypothetical protein VN066_08045, partial [Rhodocyclaceae bacterium]|nr:hypothetical protein [Rhodocyclaceae bacterium]
MSSMGVMIGEHGAEEPELQRQLRPAVRVGVPIAIVPPGSPQILGMLEAALGSSLVERGAAQGLALLGSADAFWRAVPLAD